jgi:hypothetical protein
MKPEKQTTSEILLNFGILTIEDRNSISSMRLHIVEGGTYESYCNLIIDLVDKNKKFMYKKRLYDLYRAYLTPTGELK